MTDNIQKILMAEIEPVIKEQGFLKADDVYKNETYAFKIEHSEEEKLLKLYCATVDNGEVGDFSEASAFLFEDPENERDAMSAGLDFVDTIKTRFGIKNTKNANANIILPKADKKKSPDIDSFTGTMLSVFPEFKETYKEEVERFGGFMAIDFYKRFIAPKAAEILLSNNRKQIKKLLSTLSDMYEQGDKIVGDIVVGIILTKAADFDKEKADIFLSYMDDYPYLKPAFKNYFELSVKDKKIKEMLA